MPEQAEAEQPAQDVGRKPLANTCAIMVRSHNRPSGDVAAVAADQAEEGGQEGAARRAVAVRDKAGELVDLEEQEARPEQAGHDHAAVVQAAIVRARADRGDAAGEARDQQAGGLESDIVQVEQIRCPPGRRPSRPAAPR